MLVGPTRARFLAAVSAVAVGAVIACNSAVIAPLGSGDTPLSKALPPCPARFADVATATCSVEGQSCTFLGPCATFPSNVTCICTGGTFTCDGFAEAGTACPVLTTQPCPVSEKVASGLFCSEPGLICTYPSACAGIPAYDSCQCIGGVTADDQPHFECAAACVRVADATAPRMDATAPDAQAQGDAPADAAPSIDGAGDP